MDTRTQRRLRLDRRLTDRRGWIAPEELERELAALPDVTDTAAQPSADEPDAPSEGAGSDSHAPSDE